MSFIFNGSFNVGNEGLIPDAVPGCYVSANLFRMLGVSPVMGRDFSPQEDTPGTGLVVLISDTLWKQRYGGDRAIVGRTIRIVDAPGTIIGVMPDGMHFPFNADIWLPIGTMPAALADQPRQARGYFAVGRLADGVTFVHIASLEGTDNPLTKQNEENGCCRARRHTRSGATRPAPRPRRTKPPGRSSRDSS
jgi:hypothetical protein